ASGIAFLFVPISTAAFANLPSEQNTAASGLVNLARNIGGSVGIAVSTTYVARWSQVHQTYLAGHVSNLDTPYRHMVEGLIVHFTHLGRAPVDAMRQALMETHNATIGQATILAYLDVFRMMGWFFLLSLPLCFLMRKPKRGGLA